MLTGNLRRLCISASRRVRCISRPISNELAEAGSVMQQLQPNEESIGDLTSAVQLETDESFNRSPTSEYESSDFESDSANKLDFDPRGYDFYSCIEPEPDVKADLLSTDSMADKFAFLQVQRHLRFMAKQKYPLPPQFTKQQWRDLMELKSIYFRNAYIDVCLFDGKKIPRFICDHYRPLFGDMIDSEKLIPPKLPNEDIESIMKKDKMWQTKKLFDTTYTAYTFVDFDDPVVAEMIRNIEFVYDDMRRQSLPVPFAVTDNIFTGLMESHKKVHKVAKILHFAATVFTREGLTILTRRVKWLKGLICRYENRNKSGYGMGLVSVFHRIFERDIDLQYDWLNNRELMFMPQFRPDFSLPSGQDPPQILYSASPIIMDLQFFETMTMKRAVSVVCREFLFSVRFSRSLGADKPMIYCNYNRNGRRSMLLPKHISNFEKESFGGVLTERSYMDLFPQNKLVYLSPDSKNPLRYDPGDIYIIGAMHDQGSGIKCQSLAQAKKDGIRHARLPLKEVIGIGPELNVESCVAIMYDLCASSGDWLYAFRWIPPRYFRSYLRSYSPTRRSEAIYLAQKQLCPSYNSDLIGLKPAEYRTRYAQILLDNDYKSDKLEKSIHEKYQCYKAKLKPEGFTLPPDLLD